MFITDYEHPEVSIDAIADRLRAGEVVEVGRQTTTGFLLLNEDLPLLVSRAHSRLRLNQEALEVFDCNSVNGTFIDGGRITSEVWTKVRPANVLSFGGPPTLLRDRTKIPNPFTFRYAPQNTATQNDGMRQARAGGVIGLNLLAGSPETVTAVPRRLGQSPLPVSIALPSAAMHVGARAAGPAQRQWQPAVRGPLHPGGEAVLSKDIIVDLTLDSDDEATGTSARKRSRGAPEAAKPDTMGSVQVIGKAEDEAAAALEKQSIAEAAGGAQIVAKIQTEFECVICKEWLVAAHSIVPCGHMFCGTCLKDWFERSNSRGGPCAALTCPTCRTTPTAPPVRVLAVDNLIDGIVPEEDKGERKRRQAMWQGVAEVTTKTWQTRLGGAHGRAPAGVNGRSGTLARLADLMGMARATPFFSGDLAPGMAFLHTAFADFADEPPPVPRQTARRGRAFRAAPQPGAAHMRNLVPSPRPARSPRGRVGNGVPGWPGWSHAGVPAPRPPPEGRAPAGEAARADGPAAVIGGYARPESRLHCAGCMMPIGTATMYLQYVPRQSAPVFYHNDCYPRALVAQPVVRDFSHLTPQDQARARRYFSEGSRNRS